MNSITLSFATPHEMMAVQERAEPFVIAIGQDMSPPVVHPHPKKPRFTAVIL
jgi:hypothetical protein